MKAPVQQSNFKPVPSGAHTAILFQLIDLGTQEGEYNGEVKHQRKVRLGFEIHSDDAVTDDGKPMVIGRTFTLSMYDTAKLRQFIEGWRGTAFDDDAASAFDFKAMLGKACILNVTHNKASNGKTYANIDSAIRLMKGMAEPVPVNAPVYFYMGDDETGHSIDEAIYTALPDWMRESIDKSPEYRRAIGLPDPEPKSTQKSAETADKPFDDEIPF
ncbi:hypothetical protein QWJ07_03880 [Frankia sp. RB7]|nr:hypothetical protein [Frankia sp. RB7]